MRFTRKVGKTTWTEIEEADWLLIISKICFFSAVKLNSPRHIYWNLHLFLVIMHWSYFKHNDLFHTLNIFKIPAKEHDLVLRWTGDEISVLKILFCKYLKYVPLILLHFKKLKTTKVLRYNFFLFWAPNKTYWQLQRNE